MNISLIGNSAMRIAVQRNLVSFPSRIPALMNRPGDTQERIAQLYFAGGWSIRSICDRYGLSKAMVRKLLSEWRIRAVAAGYIQDIHPEDLGVLALMKDEDDVPPPGYIPRPLPVSVHHLPNSLLAGKTQRSGPAYSQL